MTLTTKIALASSFLIAIGLGGSLYVYHKREVAAAVQVGIQEQKTIDLTRATELVKQRDELKKQDRTATRADICRRLDGVWDDGAGECN